MKAKKLLALGLCLTTVAATVLTGCGGSSSSSGEESDTSFTYLLDMGENTIFADEYEDLPAAQYWMSKTWNVDGEDVQISVDFITPPSGSEQDNFNTLLATGEYPDVMAMSYASSSAASLYEEGIVIDLTDYVDQYMPNYKAWMEEHPDLAAQMTYDGKIIELYTVSDEPGDSWSGFCYRRDWIVKYGTNPRTGEAFTGGYTDDTKKTWEDDVEFPSGGTEPVYISDWEWMFDIFETALKEEGITDGYAVQNYYAGYYSPAELVTSFGGGAMMDYVDENGDVQYGATEDSTRAFLECMNTWYEKGWMDQSFEERSADTVWFNVDSASVYSGKVGLWFGLNSQIGANMETGADDATAGICVYGAQQPINDLYGDASCQNVEPRVFYQDALVSTGVCVTNKAEEKNIGALLTAIDYMYSTEGGIVKSKGLNKEQLDEMGGSELYDKYGLSDGAYTWETDENGETIGVMNDAVNAEDGLGSAIGGCRIVGQNINSVVIKKHGQIEDQFYDSQKVYTASGNVTTLTSAQLTADESDQVSLITSNIFTYLSQEVPNFVTGRSDINDDAAWKSFCDGVKELGSEDLVEIYNK